MNKTKKLMISLLMFVGLGVAHADSGQQPKEKEVQIGISGVFVPGGFDTASDVYVVVNGIFQNGCYKWSRAEVAHQGNYHEVKSMANVSQGMCIMVLIPFQKEVRLGRFEAGEHKIRFLNGDGTYLEKSVTIE